ncbi:hypothetical protein RJ639_038651, partial [Escallonia herrerae]
MAYDTSTQVEAKRAHQWLMDASEPELFCSKKQAIGAVNSRSMSGISNVNISSKENASLFQPGSGFFSDRLFGHDSVGSFCLAGSNVFSVGGGNSNVGMKGFEDQTGHNSSVNHRVRKVKVNQVRDSDNMSASMEHSYSMGDSRTISLKTASSKSDNGISFGPSLNDGVGFPKADESFISHGHAFSNVHGSFMSMGQNHNKGDYSILMGQPNKGENHLIQMDQQYEKRNDHIISVSYANNKGHESFASMGFTYKKETEAFILMAPTLKGDDNIIPMGLIQDKVENGVLSTGTSQDKGDSCSAPMGQNYDKAISFGGFQDDPMASDPSGRIINGHELLMRQHPAQSSQAPSLIDFVATDANQDSSIASAATSKANKISKNKEGKATKKISPNSFPANVKSLLSTGILDGVPVKYVSWSWEKNLLGVVKGTSYLCGCKDCKLSNAVNAYEFERHAGCKTKHPNNHIYFENGKTIYAVVQELKSTPQDILFEAIQSVTGSPINHNNFSIWKGSPVILVTEKAKHFIYNTFRFEKKKKKKKKKKHDS